MLEKTQIISSVLCFSFSMTHPLEVEIFYFFVLVFTSIKKRMQGKFKLIRFLDCQVCNFAEGERITKDDDAKYVIVKGLFQPS